MSNSKNAISRRKATQLIMGVAALGLALGKKPVMAKEVSVRQKQLNLTKDEQSVFIKLSDVEQAQFIKLDARERSTFFKISAKNSSERSNFLKINSKD